MSHRPHADGVSPSPGFLSVDVDDFCTSVIARKKHDLPCDGAVSLELGSRIAACVANSVECGTQRTLDG
jgi:hypothetical protein